MLINKTNDFTYSNPSDYEANKDLFVKTKGDNWSKGKIMEKLSQVTTTALSLYLSLSLSFSLSLSISLSISLFLSISLSHSVYIV